MGGYNSGGVLDSAERYDFTSFTQDAWRVLAPRMAKGAACRLRSCVFEQHLGGLSGGG